MNVYDFLDSLDDDIKSMAIAYLEEKELQESEGGCYGRK